jgi:hypothetical protein
MRDKFCRQFVKTGLESQGCSADDRTKLMLNEAAKWARLSKMSVTKMNLKFILLRKMVRYDSNDGNHCIVCY